MCYYGYARPAYFDSVQESDESQTAAIGDRDAQSTDMRMSSETDATMQSMHDDGNAS
jgi:hypothetical protein